MKTKRQHIEDRARILLFVLITTVYLISLFGNAAGQYIGESCTTKNRGICRLIHNCNSAIEDLKRGLTPNSCGYDGAHPVVCCPVKAARNSRPVITRSRTRTSSLTTTTPMTITTISKLKSFVGKDPEAIAKKSVDVFILSFCPEECMEYSRWVYTLEYAPLNLPEIVVNKRDHCGMESTPFIAGSIKATSKEFPHMVAIGYGEKSNPGWHCGGTLISENFVLTSASCAFGTRGIPRWVQVGDIGLRSNLNQGLVGKNGRILQVDHGILHPDFSSHDKYYDIALLKITPLPTNDSLFIPPRPNEVVEKHPLFNEFIRPACLHTETQLPSSTATATGWKFFGYDEDPSPDLLKVQLNVLDAARCNYTYRLQPATDKQAKGILPNQICVGELEGDGDNWTGDAGGPLQYVRKDIYCMYSIIGVKPFGKTCANPNSPAVYSRVSDFLPWIVQNVWPNE